MNQKDIQEFIRQTELDLALAKDFMSMWTRRNGQAAPTMPNRNGQAELITQPRKQPEYGSSKSAIANGIAACPEQYTVLDIEKALVDLGTPLPRPSISQYMSRMVRENKVTVIKKGRGPHPALFKK